MFATFVLGRLGPEGLGPTSCERTLCEGHAKHFSVPHCSVDLRNVPRIMRVMHAACAKNVSMLPLGDAGGLQLRAAKRSRIRGSDFGAPAADAVQPAAAAGHGVPQTV